MDISKWFATLLLQIKIYLIIYAIALLICLVYAIVIYFVGNIPSISAETFTTNGVYLINTSYFQILEDAIFGNLSSILAATRKAIVFNDTFRALTILVAVLAVVLMGFTMIIGDQKITIKEFFTDIILIFGSAGILLYYDPTLSVDPNAVVQPEKYITLLYNFLQSISNFISKMLFSAVDGFMNIQYKDGTTVGYYAPIDVVASLFCDPDIAHRFKFKLAAVILSPMFFFVPILLFVLLWYLVPVVISVFIAILFAKATIMFAIQFLPFFILFSSINDVKIKVNKRAKGMDLSMKLIIEGIVQPMLFLALASFIAAMLLYIFVIGHISDIFDFSIVSTGGTYIPECPTCVCPENEPDKIGSIACQKASAYNNIQFFNNGLPRTVGLSYTEFLTALIWLWLGIVIFKDLFAKMTPIIQTIVSSASGGSAASDVFNNGGGIYNTDKDGKNSVGQMVGGVQSGIETKAQEGFNYGMSEMKKSDIAQADKALAKAGEATTKASEATTKAAEATTNAAAATAKAAEDTKKAEEATKAATTPEEKAKAEEATKAAAEATKAAEADTKKAAEDTTKAADDTTKAADETKSAQFSLDFANAADVPSGDDKKE